MAAEDSAPSPAAHLLAHHSNSLAGVPPVGAAQGHRHAISSLIATSDRKLLLSADAGSDSLLVVWDVASQQPTHTIVAPHKHGIVAMALSPGDAQLVTLGAVTSEEEAQEVSGVTSSG
jgi:WD40 repeat protein